MNTTEGETIEEIFPKLKKTQVFIWKELLSAEHN